MIAYGDYAYMYMCTSVGGILCVCVCWYIGWVAMQAAGRAGPGWPRRFVAAVAVLERPGTLLGSTAQGILHS